MILARKYKPADDNDYESLAAAGGRLRALLEAFAERTLPPEYGADKLAAYAASLILARRDDGSFSASPNPDELEADVKTDAHRFVTWAAAAFLNLLRLRVPEAASGVKDLEDSVIGALRSPSAADFSFPESGEAELVQQVEAALVLASGGIPPALRTDAGLAPELSSAIGTLISDFRRRLETGDTALPGGIDYSPLIEQALIALEA